MTSSLERLKENFDISIDWRAFELRPRGAPPISPEHRAAIERSRPRMLAMARDVYGLEINQGPFGIDSRPALIGDAYAQEQGAGDAFHHAVNVAYWQEAQSIDRPEVLEEIAASVGLDRAAFRAALDDPRYDALVQADIDQAQALGLSAVPSLVLNDAYLVTGAQPYEVLANAIHFCESQPGG